VPVSDGVDAADMFCVETVPDVLCFRSVGGDFAGGGVIQSGFSKSHGTPCLEQFPQVGCSSSLGSELGSCTI
jgi:hypothetical protein